MEVFELILSVFDELLEVYDVLSGTTVAKVAMDAVNVAPTRQKDNIFSHLRPFLLIFCHIFLSFPF